MSRRLGGRDRKVEEMPKMALPMVKGRACGGGVIQRLGHCVAPLHGDLKLQRQVFAGDAAHRMGCRRLGQMRLHMGRARPQALVGCRPHGGVGLEHFLHRRARNSAEIRQRHGAQAAAQAEAGDNPPPDPIYRGGEETLSGFAAKGVGHAGPRAAASTAARSILPIVITALCARDAVRWSG